MTEAVEIEIAHTHLYPGARGEVHGQRPKGTVPALVRFSGGATAGAMLEADRLSVEAYRTGAGTGIAAKAWRVEIGADGRLRVAARLP